MYVCMYKESEREGEGEREKQRLMDRETQSECDRKKFCKDANMRLV